MAANIIGAVRAMVLVLEAGPMNSEQRRLLHIVQQALGDGKGPVCLHENHAYEANDVLVCQDCRAKLN